MMEFESTQNLGFDDDLSDEDNQTSVDNYRAVAGEESVDEDVIYIEEEEEATLSVPPLTPYQLPYPVSASRDIVSTIEYSVQEEVHENQDSTTFPRKRKRAEDDSDNENNLVSEDESRETTELDGKAQDQSEDTMLNSRNDDNEQDDAAPAQLVTEEEQAVHSRKRRRTFTLLRSDRPRWAEVAFLGVYGLVTTAIGAAIAHWYNDGPAFVAMTLGDGSENGAGTDLMLS